MVRLWQISTWGAEDEIDESVPLQIDEELLSCFSNKLPFACHSVIFARFGGDETTAPTPSPVASAVFAVAAAESASALPPAKDVATPAADEQAVAAVQSWEVQRSSAVMPSTPPSVAGFKFSAHP